MFNEPRNWKWMVPGALVGPCLIWWSQWAESGSETAEWAGVALGLTVVLGIAALFNLVLYVYHYSADFYAEVRASQNNTPEVRMFEAARGMHPEAVKALVAHRRTLWRLKYVPVKDLVDWVLDEMPIVHAGFVDYVLDNSSSIALMPKRLLADGSKKFDPEGMVTDYEQYDALVLLMQQKLMLTQAYGSQAAQWIPPYTKELARHRFGLDEAVYEEPEGMLETVREQARVRAEVKELPSSQSVMDRLPRGNGAKGAEGPKVPELTEEEWEAMQRVEEAEMKKYRDGELPR